MVAPYKRIVGWTLFTSKEGICKELAFLVGCGQLQPNDVENAVSVYLWRLGTTQRTTPNAQCRYMCDRLLFIEVYVAEMGQLRGPREKQVCSPISNKCSKKTSVQLISKSVRVQMYAYICTRTYLTIWRYPVYKKDEFY